jgi:hypothetical protein
MTDAHATNTIRSHVEDLLGRSDAFKQLSPDQQAVMAADMAKIAEFLAVDRSWLAKPSASRATALANQPDAVDQLKQRLAQRQTSAGEDFKGGAIAAGTEQFGQLVGKVDFPQFVTSLVHGVFNAIVDASMQQMQAFGELLSATSKTVDQFAQDHITDAQARDHVANRYPSAVQVDTSGQTARLRPPASGEPNVDVGGEYGLGTVDLTDDDSEQALVNAAKLDMAKSRQQLLATMVLMGINRIVVTNGHINAKVVFDMRASDELKKRSKAELHDRESKSVGVSGFLSSILGGASASYEHETTVGSAVDDSSESKAAVKAQLTGDVQLAFKSETFPLERMVDVLGMQDLQQKAAPIPPRPRTAAPAVAPAPAPTTSGGGR